MFILVDDLGYGEMQWYPAEADISVREADATDAIPTPNLLRLAKSGVRLTNYRSAAPVCSPARAAILTSRYPQEFGFRDYLAKDTGLGIPPGTPTIASLLKLHQGYRTGHFGKWHLGTAQPQHLPGALGFDESLIRYGEEVGEGYKSTVFIRNDDYDNKNVVAENEHSTATITNAAIDFIESAAASGLPYFVNVWYQAPHNPLDPPADFPLVASGYNPHTYSSWPINWAQFVEGIPELAGLAYLEQHSATADAKNRAMYIATVAWLDFQIGRLLNRINELDPSGNTIVVFTSDNGATAKAYASGTGDQPAHWSPNGASRGAKTNVFDGGLRVPLIVSWPAAGLPEGRASDVFTLGYDFLPTLLEAAEIPVNDLSVVGVSMLNPLKGTGNAPDRSAPIVWEQKSFGSLWGGNDTVTTLDDEQYRYAVWNGNYNRKLVADRESGAFIKRYLFDAALFGVETSGELSELSILNLEKNTAARLEKEYRQWRLTATNIPAAFDEAGTTADVNGRCVDLGGSHDVAQLLPDVRFAFREGDFSFQARIELTELPGLNGAVIAEHPQSWALTVNEGPESGVLNFRLEMQARDTSNLEFPGTAGDVVAIEGNVACGIPCLLNIGFTLLGVTGAETSARLYADGAPIAEFRGNGKTLPPDFKEVYAADSGPILIGNNAAGSAGFTGQIVDPVFYLATLTPSEIVSVMGSQEGVVCDSGGCH